MCPLGPKQSNLLATTQTVLGISAVPYQRASLPLFIPLLLLAFPNIKGRWTCFVGERTLVEELVNVNACNYCHQRANWIVAQAEGGMPVRRQMFD